MKILVLSHEYPPIGGGGGQVVKDIAAGFAADQHEVRIITAHWGNLPLITQEDTMVIERLPSSRKLAYRASFISMAAYVWKAFWHGLRLIRRWRPDIIHAHFAVPAGAAAAALNFLQESRILLLHMAGTSLVARRKKLPGGFSSCFHSAALSGKEHPLLRQ